MRTFILVFVFLCTLAFSRTEAAEPVLASQDLQILKIFYFQVQYLYGQLGEKLEWLSDPDGTICQNRKRGTLNLWSSVIKCELDDAKFYRVVEMDVSNRKLTSAPITNILYLAKVRVINAAHNAMKDVKILDQLAIKQAPYVTLDFSHNQIEEQFPDKLFQTQKFANLKNLYLQGNKFTGVAPGSLCNFENFDVSDNNLLCAPELYSDECKPRFHGQCQEHEVTHEELVCLNLCAINTNNNPCEHISTRGSSTTPCYCPDKRDDEQRIDKCCYHPCYFISPLKKKSQGERDTRQLQFTPVNPQQPEQQIVAASILAMVDKHDCYATLDHFDFYTGNNYYPTCSAKWDQLKISLNSQGH